MNTKTTIPISEARKKIFKIAEESQKPGNYYTLTENGRPKAVIMSANDFDSWQETMEVIKEFPDLKKDIKETERAVRSGEHRSWVTLEDLLSKEGFVIADKSLKKYGISTKGKTKRAKRTKQTIKRRLL
ncbi:type II toxin-antitoxin system Phd/YefM family antitoxin [Patescibacteria group bacterium]|nr:type II toxin-antitoxin system Phd/YefM family antitoxin [Patescibacteria group bacterium]MBU4367384.1 type II toxin-antitoxin system Phd/YefM family antitoxin [Patescibacteria group bacterium]MBU4461705.1 type II toxin-antitoxin system Phd/YefM family antitoxin [Patescibacteria group bacterium]MCG2700088.1 type II toxin-antitoxin system Phd/YefM family antitoxin [Candidatus Parcubacteria bacterium]